VSSRTFETCVTLELELCRALFFFLINRSGLKCYSLSIFSQASFLILRKCQIGQNEWVGSHRIVTCFQWLCSISRVRHEEMIDHWMGLFFHLYSFTFSTALALAKDSKAWQQSYWELWVNDEREMFRLLTRLNFFLSFSSDGIQKEHIEKIAQDHQLCVRPLILRSEISFLWFSLASELTADVAGDEVEEFSLRHMGPFQLYSQLWSQFLWSFVPRFPWSRQRDELRWGLKSWLLPKRQ